MRESCIVGLADIRRWIDLEDRPSIQEVVLVDNVRPIQIS